MYTKNIKKEFFRAKPAFLTDGAVLIFYSACLAVSGLNYGANTIENIDIQ
jgi:hypothetical protein